MDETLNTIRQDDCIAAMNALPSGSVDLLFADPPFNIGYDYDVYRDSLENSEYLKWSREWMSAACRVLKPTGTFWLAIGDEFAAELKVSAREIGFFCRSWVVWYYTFGVNCSRKFTRSHAHLFHFVKDAETFTFNEGDGKNFIRVPSARQLVYNDNRANATGRLPDDTWIIPPADAAGELNPEEESWAVSEVGPPSDEGRSFTLRPQDLDECFNPAENTWYYPRVAGTFKQRAGFHGCQMPEQILARIIRTCSNEGELVLDPFSGSATTLAVAKKLGRRYLGFDVSKQYVEHGLARLDNIRVGDPPDGAPEPLVSAPKTGRRTRREQREAAKKDAAVKAIPDQTNKERRYAQIQWELTQRGVLEAFRLAHDGFSADRVVVDPALNEEFLSACRKLGLVGEPRLWNTMLFRLRKAGRLATIATHHHTVITWEECDRYLFASEIALQTMLDEGAESLDHILCNPGLAGQFDQRAHRLAPGFQPLEYRWAALKLRKQAKVARSRAAVLPEPRLDAERTIDELLNSNDVPEQPGVYLLSGNSDRLYAGESMNLKARFIQVFGDPDVRAHWETLAEKPLSIQTCPTHSQPADALSWQCRLSAGFDTRLNFHELRPLAETR